MPEFDLSGSGFKKLKKQIKDESTVKGSIEKKAMLDMISSASVSTGIFNTKKMHSDLLPESADMFDKYGYIEEQQINQILKMDKIFNRNYWNKQIKRLSNCDIDD